MTQKLTLSALVFNRAGVLLRVAGLFARRGYNILSLIVCATEDPDFSRLTVVALAEHSQFSQVEKQLTKLEDVVRVVRLNDNAAVESELLLIKVRAVNSERPTVLKTISAHGARVRDIGHVTLTAEFTGTTDMVDRFIADMSVYGIAELSRTGVAALESGDGSISQKEKEVENGDDRNT